MIKEFITEEFLRNNPHNACLMDIATLMGDERAIDDLSRVFVVAEHFQNHYQIVHAITASTAQPWTGSATGLSNHMLRYVREKMETSKRIFFIDKRGIQAPNIRRARQWIKACRVANDWCVPWNSVKAGEDVIDSRFSSVLMDMGLKPVYYHAHLGGIKSGANSLRYKTTIANFAESKLDLVWDVKARKVPVSVAIAYETSQYGIARKKKVAPRDSKRVKGMALSANSVRVLYNHFEQLILSGNLQTAIWRACLIRRILGGRDTLFDKKALSQLAVECVSVATQQMVKSKTNDPKALPFAKNKTALPNIDEPDVEMPEDTIPKREQLRQKFVDKTLDQIRALDQFTYEPATGAITDVFTGKEVPPSAITFKCDAARGFVSRGRFIMFYMFRKNNVPLEHAYHFLPKPKNSSIYGTQAYWKLSNWHLQAKRQTPEDVVKLVADTEIEVKEREL